MPTALSRMSALAATVSRLTADLDKYHSDNQIPEPSFEENNGVVSYPEELEQKRSTLSDACRELDELITGPRNMIFAQLYPRQNYFEVIYEFQIANRVPKDGHISYTDLANEVGVSEVALKRVLRYAISNRIFMEKESGKISHSVASRLLADEPAMLDWLGVTLHEILPSAAKQADALKKWPQADEPSEAAYMLAKGINEPSFFAHLAKSPQTARQFAGAMKIFNSGDEYSMRHLIDNYPWASFGEGTIVDLGGSTGQTAFSIAERFPDLKIVVQDLPKTIAAANERSGVNVTFMSHDFFEEQPIKGADVYLYRWCFHSWHDKYAVRMLKSLIPALKPGARILIMDGLIPAPGSRPNIEERWLRGMDCGMMATTNARERELDEWKDLFSSVDRRFVWKGVVEPKGSKLALIEIIWDPQR